MINKFTSTVFDPNQKEIARVNRTDGTLYLKPQIWKLLPQGEKDFVLYHEEGHLVLQTTDEFEANLYAIKNYVPSHILTNPELKARIVVMQSILTPGRENNTSGFSGTTAASGGGGGSVVGDVAQAVGAIFTALPLIGVGKGAREEEAQKQGLIQEGLIKAQADASAVTGVRKNQTNIILGVLAGAFIIAGIVLYYTFKTGKK